MFFKITNSEYKKLKEKYLDLKEATSWLQISYS